MIKVITEKQADNYKKVSILGHAMYDDYGKYIVCSAVSSIVTTTINGILRIKNGSLSYLTDKEGVIITVNSTDKITQILIENMVSLLKELESNYPKNIQVK